MMSGRVPAIGASDEINFGTDRANLSQFEAQAIPESHPVLPRLNELFGDHTFFVDSDGLSIVEPIDGPLRGELEPRGRECCELER